MNPQIEKLYTISRKKSRRIIGLMSGTSLDGLDIALCQLTGNGPQTALLLEQFITLPYNTSFRNQVREVFAKRAIDQQTLCGLNALIGDLHGSMILDALRHWNISPEDVDLIASHGQTVYHAPNRLTGDSDFPNSTLQIGDGDHIALRTGIITISDFRQKHIAAGGEGAPLAAYGDFLLFSHPTENRFLLNIGGISNFTFLPKGGEQLAYATDLGPGNTMMNQYMHAHLGLEMDKDAQMARQGLVNHRLLNILLDTPFLKDDFPKTTGPELFNLEFLQNAQQASGTVGLADADVLATLNKFAAEAIVSAIHRVSDGLENVVVYVSGGGLHNPLLIEHIKEGLGTISLHSFARLGLDPDAKEACLFAVLANESVAGSPEHVAAIKESPAVCMGKISLPY